MLNPKPYGTIPSLLPYSMYIQVYVHSVYPDVSGVCTYILVSALLLLLTSMKAQAQLIMAELLYMLIF